MFGSPRSGTTWLLNLLRSAPGVAGIDESGIGHHLTPLIADVMNTSAASVPVDAFRVNDARRSQDDYFFAERFASSWREPLRQLLLSRFTAHLASMPERPAACVIKEPNGTQAADVLLDLLPSSRLLVVVRDARDVIDSQLDASSLGSWRDRWVPGREMDASQRMAFVEDQAARWLFRMRTVLAAYESRSSAAAHLVRYEDLRRDTLAGVKAIFDWLGVAPGDDIATEVDSMAFERIPSEQRGQGRFTRAATPGLWRENLSDDEQAVIGRILDETLVALGYEPTT